MRMDLRQQAGGAVLAGFAYENRAKFESAANGLFDDAKALNRALTRGGQFVAMECQPQLLEKGVVAAFDSPQPAGVFAWVARPRDVFHMPLLMGNHTRYSARDGCSCYLYFRKYPSQESRIARGNGENQ